MSMPVSKSEGDLERLMAARQRKPREEALVKGLKPGCLKPHGNGDGDGDGDGDDDDDDDDDCE